MMARRVLLGLSGGVILGAITFPLSHEYRWFVIYGLLGAAIALALDGNGNRST